MIHFMFALERRGPRYVHPPLALTSLLISQYSHRPAITQLNIMMHICSGSSLGNSCVASVSGSLIEVYIDPGMISSCASLYLIKLD